MADLTGSPLVTKYCTDHSAEYLGVCPFCARGVWPSRDLQAARDFSERRLQAAALEPINYAVAVRDLLDKLVEAERPVAEALKAAAETRGQVRKGCRQISADYSALTRAARIYAGIPGAEISLQGEHGQKVRDYLELLIDRDVKW